MAIPVLADYFGTGTTAVTNPGTFEPTEPGLFIPLSALTESGGLSETASLSNPDKVIWAIFQKVTSWLRADTTEQPYTEASQVSESRLDRAGVRMNALNYSFTVYVKAAPIAMDVDLQDANP